MDCGDSRGSKGLAVSSGVEESSLSGELIRDRISVVTLASKGDGSD